MNEITNEKELVNQMKSSNFKDDLKDTFKLLVSKRMLYMLPL